MATNNQSNSSPIKFPSRAQQDEGRLRDCFRIMAWKQFKKDYNGDLKGLELYAVFDQDWSKHEIQGWDYQQMSDFAESLGYTAGELLKARNRYYELRDQARIAAEQPVHQPMYQQPMYQQPYPMYQQPMQPAPPSFESDEEGDTPPF